VLTDEEICDQSANESRIAFKKLRERRLNAGVHCWRALTVLDNMKDLRMKRNCLLVLAEQVFKGLKCFDLSLFAIQSAIEIDKSLSDTKSLAQDLLVYGNINMDLGNTYSAIEAYRKTIEINLKNQDFANAASASTNLAIMLANNYKLEESITLLNQSLSYLDKKPFPDTEITTRLALIRILSLKNIEATKVIENAEVLFNLYSAKIPQNTKSMVAGALEQAIQRYLLDHPELDLKLWRAQKLSLLNYWRSR
jgi:tetratricopeptide (TPR) repeat protein